MPQSERIRPALTAPIFGSAKRTSRTLAVRTYSGGWARIWASSIVPDASSFFSFALADRISLASRRARRRCSRDLPAALASALPADTRASLGPAPGGRSTLSAGEDIATSACRGLLETRHESFAGSRWCRRAQVEPCLHPDSNRRLPP